eukprot:10339948-Karenia_brevis.AAC.1
MVAEQNSDPEKDLGFQSKSTDEELMRMMGAFFKSMLESNKENVERRSSQIVESRDDTRSAKLEEKNFRRIDKFDGNSKEFRGWVFNLEVALGQVDKE